MLGFIIGAVSGVVQYLLLSKFTGSLTGSKFGKKTVLFAVTQFLFPFAVLVVCAFLLSDELLLVAIGIASALIISAVIKYIVTQKSGKS